MAAAAVALAPSLRIVALKRFDESATKHLLRPHLCASLASWLAGWLAGSGCVCLHGFVAVSRRRRRRRRRVSNTEKMLHEEKKEEQQRRRVQCVGRLSLVRQCLR